MSPKERMAKLERLLARVSERAGSPRPRLGGAAAFAASPAPVVPVSAASPAASVPPADIAAAAMARVASQHPPAAPAREASVPPDAYESGDAELEIGETVDLDADDVAAAEAEGYADGDVEVTSEVVEVDIDEDVEDGSPMESGSQLVAQPQIAAEEDVEEVVDDDEPAAELEESGQVAQVAVPANEVAEPAPSSSRRPIADDAEAEAYAEESAPRHTPPPESGKQVAAPSVQPAARRSSAPPSSAPPSVEGHTLIGGWREPGIPRDVAARLPSPMGGHAPAPPIVAPPVVAPPSAAAAAPPAAPPAPATALIATPFGEFAPPGAGVVQSPPSSSMGGPPTPRISPEVTRALLPAAGKVASFEGAAPAFKPANFGELLDASLAL